MKYKNMKIKINILIIILISLPTLCMAKKYDVVIYGGTSSGIISAVQASKDGRSVVMIEPSAKQGGLLGGLTTGGLSMTDHGKKSSIGGLALDFYNRVGKEYNYGGPAWRFEPKIALKVYHEMIKEQRITVVYNERIALDKGVIKKGNKIHSIKMESGKTFEGKIFIDATYEGDLMALAGVSYTVGREPNSKYGETFNGIVERQYHLNVPAGIDPYIEKGNPAGGLLPWVNPDLGGNIGDGDSKVMAYCYRMCMTDDPNNRVMIEKPANYNEMEYELLFRAFEKGFRSQCFQLTPIQNKKTDSNMGGGISTNYVGASWNYPEANYETRENIRKAHENYQKGFVWTVQNHPRIPLAVRNFYKIWGLAKDEFVENNNWSPQLYIRESRRMVSDCVVTENEIFQKQSVKKPIGLASYNIDSHPVQYCIGKDGFVRAEGATIKSPPKAYQLDYGIITPPKSDCENLLVSVCVSASHSAYTSLRMEPVYMILGQSAAVAASLAIEGKVPVQDIDYNLLKERLLAVGQIIEDTTNDKFEMDDSKNNKQFRTISLQPTF
ncbi:xanthan lyase [Bacteroidia bacterium]|nr:xanthan lyase [Bacteroidia bacterium]